MKAFFLKIMAGARFVSEFRRLLSGLIALGPALMALGPPPNDNFASRMTISSATNVTFIGGSTIGATRELGEPTLGGQPGGQSIWYQWTAPYDIPVHVRVWAVQQSPVEIHFAPKIGVFAGGPGFSTLVPVKAFWGMPLGPESTVINFRATGGTTYYLAVDPGMDASISVKVDYYAPQTFYWSRYRDLNSDLGAEAANVDVAWRHYYNYGIFEHRPLMGDFEVEEYLELNPDVKAIYGTDWQGAMLHWYEVGQPLEHRVGRVPTGFKVDAYLARYPDLYAAFGAITPRAVRNVTVWHHYLDWGITEGRSDGDFDVYNYLATNPDLVAAFGNDIHLAALHWYFYGRAEGRRIPKGFNLHNYISWNQDLALYFDSTDLYAIWEHYRDYGVYEGRIYDGPFRVDEYLALNPDVAAAVGNDRRGALLHWLNYGQYEGRQAHF